MIKELSETKLMQDLSTNMFVHVSAHTRHSLGVFLDKMSRAHSLLRGPELPPRSPSLLPSNNSPALLVLRRLIHW